jgi:hypothetical protein
MAKKNKMKYPTKEEIETASKEQLGRWCRFLINPSTEEHRTILHLILKRFLSRGGWTETLSKKVGWDPNKKSGKIVLIDNMPS